MVVNEYILFYWPSVCHLEFDELLESRDNFVNNVNYTKYVESAYLEFSKGLLKVQFINLLGNGSVHLINFNMKRGIHLR